MYWQNLDTSVAIHIETKMISKNTMIHKLTVLTLLILSIVETDQISSLKQAQPFESIKEWNQKKSVLNDYNYTRINTLNGEDAIPELI